MHLSVFKWLVLGGALAFVFTIVYYFYSKKNRNFAMVYGSVNTLVMVVVAQELIWLTSKSIDDLDGGQAFAALLASVSMLNYNSLHLATSYTISTIYIAVRTYWLVDNRFRHATYVLYYLVAFVFFYSFARAFIKVDRKAFRDMRKQNQLL